VKRFALLFLLSGCATTLPKKPATFTVLPVAEAKLLLLHDVFSNSHLEMAFCAYGSGSDEKVVVEDIRFPNQKPTELNVAASFSECKQPMLAWGHSHIQSLCILSTEDIAVLMARPEDYTILVCRVSDRQTRQTARTGELVIVLYTKSEVLERMEGR